MPTVKQYQDGTGLYIRSNIDGKFVTLQLSPQAEGLISDLGYEGNDQILWDFLQPLCNCGHVYTNNSGTEIATDATDLDSTLSSDALSSEEKTRISDFLEDVSLGDQQGSMSSQSNNSDFEHITERKKGFLEKWSSSEDEYETNLDRITKARDSMGILKSVSQHATEHPMRPSRFRVSSQGVPIYSFDTNDTRWIVHDFRKVSIMHTDAELFFSIQPGTDKNQSVTIENSNTEWHTDTAQFTEEQINQFMTVFPDILYYINNLPDCRNISLDSIIENSTAELPEGDEDRISNLKHMQSKNRSERVIGTVVSTNKGEAVRIRGHTGYTYTPERKQNQSQIEDISIGTILSFETKYDGGSVHAKNITEERLKIPVSKFLEDWSDSHDKSVSWVKNNWIQQSEDNQTMNLNLQVDSLTYHILKNKEISINESIRILLDDIIDGENIEWTQSAETTQVTATVSADTLSMVDLAVEMSPSIQSRSQFVNTALQNSLKMSETTEITFSIPQCYYQYMSQIMDKNNISTEQLGREAIEKLLIEWGDPEEISSDTNESIGT